MKYNAEGVISVGQEFNISGVKADFSEIFDKSLDLIGEGLCLGQELSSDMVSIKPINKNQSLVLNFDQIGDDTWNVEVNAIYDVEFKFDTNREHKDLAKMKVVKLLNKYQEVKSPVGAETISTIGIKLDKTEIKTFNVKSYGKNHEAELAR